MEARRISVILVMVTLGVGRLSYVFCIRVLDLRQSERFPGGDGLPCFWVGEVIQK